MDSQSFEQPPETGDSHPTTEMEFASVVQRPHRRGSVVLAWIAIVAVLIIAVVPHFVGGQDESDDPSTIIAEIQAKYLVGAASFSETAKSTYQAEISSLFGRGPLRHRLIGVVLQGELLGPDVAAKSLSELEAKIENDSIDSAAPDKEIVRLLQKMQQSRIDKQDVESNLSDEERQACRRLLPNRLGWVGKLALLPPGAADQISRSNLLSQAQRTLFVVFGVFGLGVVAAACGAVLQIVWWIFAAMGRLNSGIGAIRGNHVIYAETFAVWMALFLALSYLVSIPMLSKFGLGMILVPQIGGLAALAWPVFRGIRWCDVRDDIGLRVGPQGWMTPFVGIGTYLSRTARRWRCNDHHTDHDGGRQSFCRGGRCRCHARASDRRTDSSWKLERTPLADVCRRLRLSPGGNHVSRGLVPTPP